MGYSLLRLSDLHQGLLGFGAELGGAALLLLTVGLSDARPPPDPPS